VSDELSPAHRPRYLDRSLNALRPRRPLRRLHRSVIVRRWEASGDGRNRSTDFDVTYRRMTG